MKPLFFVTCVPRCGSQWLTQLLDTAPGVRCYHANYLVKNVVGGDIQFMIDSWKAKDPCQYLYESREQIALLTEREAPGVKGWGEVNEFIRYYAPTVREVFGVPVVGLIRNGHLTIPSLLRHNFYDPNKAGEWPSAIEPKGQEMCAVWPKTTQFERCCWLWSSSYRNLLSWDVPIFTLESLNAEFGYVERLCEILRIDISYEDWQEHANKPVDDFYQGCEEALPPDQLEMFNRWAGDVQEYFYG